MVILSHKVEQLACLVMGNVQVLEYRCISNDELSTVIHVSNVAGQL